MRVQIRWKSGEVEQMEIMADSMEGMHSSMRHTSWTMVKQVQGKTKGGNIILGDAELVNIANAETIREVVGEEVDASPRN